VRAVSSPALGARTTCGRGRPAAGLARSPACLAMIGSVLGRAQHALNAHELPLHPRPVRQTTLVLTDPSGPSTVFEYAFGDVLPGLRDSSSGNLTLAGFPKLGVSSWTPTIPTTPGPVCAFDEVGEAGDKQRTVLTSNKHHPKTKTNGKKPKHTKKLATKKRAKKPKQEN